MDSKVLDASFAEPGLGVICFMLGSIPNCAGTMV